MMTARDEHDMRTLIETGIRVVEDQTERLSEFLGASERDGDPGLLAAGGWTQQARRWLAGQPLPKMSASEAKDLAQAMRKAINCDKPFSWTTESGEHRVWVDNTDDLLYQPAGQPEVRFAGKAAELRHDPPAWAEQWLGQLIRNT